MQREEAIIVRKRLTYKLKRGRNPRGGEKRVSVELADDDALFETQKVSDVGATAR